MSGAISASEVHILGKKVHLSETSRIEARGGEVLVGGDYKGQNPEVQNAQMTQIDTGALINVDGGEGENGGRVIVWADEGAWYGGHISGRGENGGFVEVSGKKTLQYSGFADLRPVGDGDFGTLLIDPQSIVIDGGAGAVMVGVNTLFGNMVGSTVMMGAANVSAAIDAATLILQANTDIDVQASVTGTVLGNGLTLQAGRSILFSTGDLTLNGGAFSATVNDSAGMAGDRLAGPAQFNMNAGRSIATSGGDVVITHGSLSGTSEGEVVMGAGSSIDSGSGRIDITGTGISGSNLIGIDMQGSLTTTGTGAGAGIALTGTGSAAANNSIGVRIYGTISGVEGNLVVTGNGGGNGTGTDNYGIQVDFAGSIFSTGMGPDAAAITLLGTGGGGTDNNHGVLLGRTNPMGFISSIDGAILVNGTGNGTGQLNHGVFSSRVVAPPSTTVVLQSTGVGPNAATITVIGTAGAGTNTNVGIDYTVGSNGPISTVDGDVFFDGTGQGTAMFSAGIYLRAEAGVPLALQSTGVGAVEFIGQSSVNGTDFSLGVAINRVSTVSGNITVNGTGNGSGIFNTGAQLADVFATGTASVIATGVGFGTDSIGVLTAGNTTGVSVVDGDIIFTGTGSGSGFTDQGILIQPPGLFSTGLGEIVLTSLGNDIELTRIPAGIVLSTASSDVTMTALTGSANISILTGGNVSCGGSLIAAANNNFTIAPGVTFSVTGDATIVVDEQSGTMVGPGLFTNSGTITVASNNLAIYAVQGPQEPVGIGPFPSQVTFGNLSPNIEVWDASILFPDPLNAKYDTSYQAGGPYHGPGFGMSYLPGNGVFGSIVVWYKVFAQSPPVPPVPPIPFILPAVQRTLSLVGVNTTVYSSPQNYLMDPYFPCPILPCLKILCAGQTMCLPSCYKPTTTKSTIDPRRPLYSPL